MNLGLISSQLTVYRLMQIYLIWILSRVYSSKDDKLSAVFKLERSFLGIKLFDSLHTLANVILAALDLHLVVNDFIELGGDTHTAALLHQYLLNVIIRPVLHHPLYLLIFL